MSSVEVALRELETYELTELQLAARLSAADVSASQPTEKPVDDLEMIAKDRIDYRLEYTTGNPDVIYAFAWLDLKKDGLMVLDMPTKLRGKHAA